MAKNILTTGELLLKTAAELFAEHGFKGTSVKMIAERAGQNIAAVNYHFGSKQNLFIQALKTVMQNIMRPVSKSVAKTDENSREALDGEFRQFVHDRCNFLLSTTTPAWYGPLIVRAVLETPAAVQEIGLQFFLPDFEYLENFGKKINPAMSTEKAKLWAYSVIGQVFFYVFGRKMILLANSKSFFDANKIDKIADHVCEISLNCFNL